MVIFASPSKGRARSRGVAPPRISRTHGRAHAHIRIRSRANAVTCARLRRPHLNAGVTVSLAFARRNRIAVSVAALARFVVIPFHGASRCGCDVFPAIPRVATVNTVLGGVLLHAAFTVVIVASPSKVRAQRCSVAIQYHRCTDVVTGIIACSGHPARRASVALLVVRAFARRRLFGAGPRAARARALVAVLPRHIHLRARSLVCAVHGSRPLVALRDLHIGAQGLVVAESRGARARALVAVLHRHIHLCARSLVCAVHGSRPFEALRDRESGAQGLGGAGPRAFSSHVPRAARARALVAVLHRVIHGCARPHVCAVHGRRPLVALRDREIGAQGLGDAGPRGARARAVVAVRRSNGEIRCNGENRCNGGHRRLEASGEVLKVAVHGRRPREALRDLLIGAQGLGGAESRGARARALVAVHRSDRIFKARVGRGCCCRVVHRR